jgi:tetrahydromethanopterin S-methyltransferase subunit G
MDAAATATTSPGTKTFPTSLTGKSMSLDSSNGDEPVDPRVAVELESLNSATNEINKLEKELEKANAKFRQLLTSTSGQLEVLGKRIGMSNIDRARPFYEALAIAQTAHRACLSAATQFSRANDLHAAAKSTEVAITESKSNSKCLDSVLQEVLNHATLKVMEAEKLKKDSELTHRLRAEDFTKAESRVHELEKHLSREIEKSRPYFELKNQLNINLLCVKTEIESIQNSIATAKATYAASLNRLECISEEIHHQRNANGRSVSGASTASQSPASSARCESPGDHKSRYERHSSSCSSSSSFSNGSTCGKERGSLPRRSSPVGAEAETEPETKNQEQTDTDTDLIKQPVTDSCELTDSNGEETRL